MSFSKIIIIKEDTENLKSKCLKTIFFSLVTFFIGSIIVGIYVAHKAFGTGWSGFPLGSDITDNKSLALILMWGYLIIIGKRKKFIKFKINDLTFAKLIIFLIILTIIIYLIPHSYFIQ